MTILITGTRDLMANVLARSLAASGHRVRVLTRSPHTVPAWRDKGVEAFEWHPLTDTVPDAALEGVDLIFHLLTEPLEGALTPEKLERMADLPLEGMRKLVQAAQRRPGGINGLRLLVRSSVAVYAGGGMALHDSAPVGPHTAFSYGEIPARVEQEAAALQREGVTVFLARFGAILGPDGLFAVLRDLGEQGLLATRSSVHTCPVVALADAVGACAFVGLKSRDGGAVNIATPQTISAGKIVSLVADACTPRLRWPQASRTMRARCGAYHDLLSKARNVVPQRLIDTGFAFTQPDPEHVLQAALKTYVTERDAARAKRPSVLAWRPTF
ncbi:MAG: NAD-dependent epimerase/dehydratase family protein [Pseudomonadota bacterium]